MGTYWMLRDAGTGMPIEAVWGRSRDGGFLLQVPNRPLKIRAGSRDDPFLLEGTWEPAAGATLDLQAQVVTPHHEVHIRVRDQVGDPVELRAATVLAVATTAEGRELLVVVHQNESKRGRAVMYLPNGEYQSITLENTGFMGSLPKTRSTPLRNAVIPCPGFLEFSYPEQRKND